MSNLTIVQQQAGIVRNQARVSDLLKWNKGVYASFLHNTGLQYLDKFCGDKQAARDLAGRAEFWNWFKNLWNARDEAFIDDWDGMEDISPVSDLRVIYRGIHDAGILACEIRPPRVVYGDDFVTIKSAL